MLQKSKLDFSSYEKLLKEDLRSWRTGDTFKNMPKLKEHLEQEWDKDARRSKAKRKREDVASDEEYNEKQPAKKATLA